MYWGNVYYDWKYVSVLSMENVGIDPSLNITYFIWLNLIHKDIIKTCNKDTIFIAKHLTLKK